MSENVIVPRRLNARDVNSFDVRPPADKTKEIAEELGLLGLKKPRLAGTIKAVGEKDWQLKATLGATITQSCVVTMEPITTRIEEAVVRNYFPRLEYLDDADDEEEEIEMSADENIEILPDEIDLFELFAEALSLAVPPYPKKDTAALPETIVAEPGIDPLTDDDVKPFAGLKDLRDKLAKK